MNLVKVFLEVCMHRIDISEACLGFSVYKIFALLTLKVLIMTTADGSFLYFLFFGENKA